MCGPLVSVVIVTWNRRDDVLEAVRSVYEQPYRPVEVVVVDNASTDGTVAALQEAYPEAKIVALERNLGAAGGRNPGIRAAAGDIIFLLDSDGSLPHDTLGTVVGKFADAPDIGVVACKVVNAFTKQLDSADGWIYSQRDAADEGATFLSYSFPEAGAAVRREVFDRVGLFADWLFFGREGEELGLRVWDAGYRILYCGNAVVYHRASPAARVDADRRLYYDTRNCLAIYLVRYPWWMAIRFALLKAGASLAKGVRRGRLGPVLRAFVDLARQVPQLWRIREPIRDETARRYLGLLREHGPLHWDIVSWFKYKR